MSDISTTLRFYRRGTCRSGLCAGLALAVAMSLAGGSPAVAQQLDGPAVQDLALSGTWDAEGEWGYWTWSADKTVCLRIFGPEDNCADTGTWNIDGDVMCYALTWFGSAYDVRENCYTVRALGDGKYETRYHGGALDSVFITFSVLD